MYEVKILADSIAHGVRLTTFSATMPRIILAEFNTHRRLSRNSASSRAIPVEKRISMTLSDPFIPAAFSANQKGMQAGEVLDAIAQDRARGIWTAAMASAVKHARDLAAVGVHKQWANRLIEPFTWQTVVCSGTEWENFFNLRCHKDAQPEIQTIAQMMRDARDASKPEPLQDGEWHLPFVDALDIDMACKPDIDYEWLAKLSTARCARVSFLTHDRGVIDRDADVVLHDRLLSSRHMSPFEHAAFVDSDVPPSEHKSNFDLPWIQYRKTIENEDIFRGN